MYKTILLDRRNQEPNEKQREMNNILNAIETGNWQYIKTVYFRYNHQFKDILDLDRKNAFFYCFKINNEEQALQIFIHLYQLKINLNHKDRMDATCLFYVVEEGKINIVKFLINEMEMSINDIDRNGRNLMFYAVKSNNIEVVKFLYEKSVILILKIIKDKIVYF
jgi:ankyrin repeat protein